MLIRSWLYVFAFIGLILAAPALSQENVERDESKPDATQGHQPAQKTPSFVTALEGVEGAIRDLVKEESEEGRQRIAQQAAKDLEAQTEMAEWAMEMALAAIAGAILTALGLFLIWRTLKATQRAAEYAKDMVDEARKTTEASMGMMRAERAWVLMSDIRVMPVSRSKENIEKTDGFQFVMYFENFGRSPATKVKIGNRIFYSRDEALQYVRSFYDRTDDPDDGSTLAPSTAKGGHGPVVDLEFFESWERGESPQCFLCGVAVYTDIFGETHKSDSSVMITPTALVETLVAKPFTQDGLFNFPSAHFGEKAT